MRASSTSFPTPASSAACPLLAQCDGVPAGITWGKVEADGVHVYQVWVAQAWRGRGVAQALLAAVIAWARSQGARAVHLGVALTATAATRLYLRAGFVPNGQPTILRNGTTLLSQPMHLLLPP